MELHVHKDQAIVILEQRLNELYMINDFDPAAWRNRATLDANAIFGDVSEQSMQVRHLDFGVLVTLQQGLNTARKLIASYIEYIKDYSIAVQEKNKSLLIQHNELQGKWNDLVSQYNNLNQNLRTKNAENENARREMERMRLKNEKLIDNTIQLDNVSLARLWMGIRNLPTGQVIAVISLLSALLVGTFSLGRLVERTGANNDLYDLRTENTRLKNEKQSLQNQLEAKPKPGISGK